MGGKDATLDVTVVNPCQTATIAGAATNAGHAGESCQRQGIAFLPMVVESLGGWHEGGGEARGSAGPPVGAGGGGSSAAGLPVARTLRQQMEQVDTVKAERQVIESEFKVREKKKFF